MASHFYATFLGAPIGSFPVAFASQIIRAIRAIRVQSKENSASLHSKEIGLPHSQKKLILWKIDRNDISLRCLKMCKMSATVFNPAQLKRDLSVSVGLD